MHCMSSLFEVRGLLKQKKFGNTADSLNHMVAVITNYLASVSLKLNFSSFSFNKL